MRYELGLARVGFWKSKSEPELPEPIDRLLDWQGRLSFIANLKALEATIRPTRYRGISMCRLCHCQNGNGEYQGHGFMWPSGFKHYVEVHRVKPPQSFIDMVNHWAQTTQVHEEGQLDTDDDEDDEPDVSEQDKLRDLLRRNLAVRVSHGELEIRFDDELICSCMITR